MRFSFGVVLAATAGSCAVSASPILLGDAHLTFEEFVERHGRAYAPGEEAMRRAVFARTKASVVEHNKAYAAGKSSWFAAINDFADRTEEELRAVKAGMPRPSTADASDVGGGGVGVGGGGSSQIGFAFEKSPIKELDGVPIACKEPGRMW